MIIICKFKEETVIVRDGSVVTVGHEIGDYAGNNYIVQSIDSSKAESGVIIANVELDK